jgi:hypothetical protein
MPRPEFGGDVGIPILRYLNEHPDAADTAAGIRQWWLPIEDRECSAAAVQAALDLLVAQGAIARIDRAGMPPVYCRATRRGGGPRTR